MMKPSALLFLVLLALSPATGLRAQEASVRFSGANDEYRAGKYREAAGMYEQILANGYESAALYYNLGNAYYKMENVPAAILNYERAKRLAPDDEDILYNLRIANLRVIDKIEPVPRLFFITWLDALLNLASSGGWAAIGIAALWLAVLFLVFIRLLPARKFRKAPVAAAVMALCLALSGFSAAAVQSGRENPGSAGIVFEQSVPVKSAPDNRSTDLFVVHEGIRVELLDTVGEWRKIRLADGKVGWIEVSALKVI
jgi:tetratricopeptide (TPR) repeat protein